MVIIAKYRKITVKRKLFRKISYEGNVFACQSVESFSAPRPLGLFAAQHTHFVRRQRERGGAGGNAFDGLNLALSVFYLNNMTVRNTCLDDVYYLWFTASKSRDLAAKKSIADGECGCHSPFQIRDWELLFHKFPIPLV